MSAEEWNHRYPTGTLVDVTLADGQVVPTRTLARARTWGGLEHIQVGGITGYVLLSWVRPRGEANRAVGLGPPCFMAADRARRTDHIPT